MSLLMSLWWFVAGRGGRRKKISNVPKSKISKNYYCYNNNNNSRPLGQPFFNVFIDTTTISVVTLWDFWNAKTKIWGGPKLRLWGSVRDATVVPWAPPFFGLLSGSKWGANRGSFESYWWKAEFSDCFLFHFFPFSDFLQHFSPIFPTFFPQKNYW